MFRCDSRDPEVMWLVLGSYNGGLPHPRESVWRPGFQERLGCPKNGHECPGGVELVLGLHQKCPEVVRLVMELHHVSQGGK